MENPKDKSEIKFHIAPRNTSPKLVSTSQLNEPPFSFFQSYFFHCPPTTQLLCVMSQFPKNVTLLLLNRCHVMLAEQPTTFGVPSWLEFLGMVHGFVKAAP